MTATLTDRPRTRRPLALRGRGAGSRPTKAKHAAYVPWLFLAVPLVLLIAFTAIPVANMIGYSFTDWDGVDPERSFVGLRNYELVATRPQLFQVFVVSGYYVLASFAQMAIALYFATILSFKVRFRNVFKGILFFPYLVNGVAIGFIFLFVFQPGGTLDRVVELFGGSGQHQWLGDPALVNWSLAGVSIWRYLGLNFVLFLGAIASIPDSLYEAAELDGANRWQVFRYVILPGIKPIVSLSFILAISGSLAVFEIPYIMTGGANGSKTFVIQTVDLAFKFNKVGLASACAVILLLLILLVTWLQRRLVPDERVDLT